MLFIHSQIDLSQRGLQASDARLVKMALLQNAHLTVLKLGYNHLGNDGASTLADGIRQHKSLASLDLGFNNIGDPGCTALAKAVSSSPPLRTLYLAGNLIRQEGAISLADHVIRKGSSLKKLYLTGNHLGPDGVAAITEAIEEDEQRRSGLYNAQSEHHNHPTTSHLNHDDHEPTQQQHQETNEETKTHTPLHQSIDAADDDTRRTATPSNRTSNRSGGIEQLFLGGTSMGSEGCRAVARLLRISTRIQVLSLTNCDLTDEDIAELSASLKSNKDYLPINSLQLSFNQITTKGVEHLVNAIWGSRTLCELLIDNNQIADRGAQQLASVLPYVPNLEQIDVGFNGIKSVGLKLFMTAVAETKKLNTLSLSGNILDPSSAKATAYALAFNRSLVSLNLVNCSTESTILRQIAAGIVSNSHIALRDLIGFEMGPLVVSLGFPEAVGHWTNEQVLNFLHTMWGRFGGHAKDSESPPDASSSSAVDQSIDPLHFLPGDTANGTSHTHIIKHTPLSAATVVEVAKKAFDSLVEEGYDVFSRRPGHPNAKNMASPLPRNASTFVLEDDAKLEVDETMMNGDDSSFSSDQIPSNNARSFVAAPEVTKSKAGDQMPDPGRKKRIVEWLCKNIKDLNKLSQQPFSSADMWRLHQHYFTPVVNESGGSTVPGSGGPSSAASMANNSNDAANTNLAISSVPEVSRTSSSENRSEDGLVSDSGQDLGPVSDPSLKQSPTALGSFSMLKRKVSYRFLGDAALSSPSGFPASSKPTTTIFSVHPPPMSSVSSAAAGSAVATMPRKNKRARRNRSRISFLPRIKSKVESQLDVCHEKALVIMRQLYFVEKAILSGEVNPIDPASTTRTHLTADFAADAEMIILDMI